MLESALIGVDTVGHLWAGENSEDGAKRGEVPAFGSISASVILIFSGGAWDIEEYRIGQ